MNLNKIFRYGILKKFHSGVTILIFTTFKCTLDCKYCTLKFLNGRMPESAIIDLDDWKKKILDFPIRVREVVLSGGEPTLLPYYNEFVNWLLEQGYFVTVYSNGTTLRGLMVKNSPRFRMAITYHHDHSLEKWRKNVGFYRNSYRVDAIELGYKKYEKSKVRKFCTIEEAHSYEAGFYYGPDGKLHTKFMEVLRYYESEKKAGEARG